jgi:hypothetical protein
MLLSELLRRRVVDDRGERLGRVHEVHLVQDGPPLSGAGDRSLRVDGLVVGRRAFVTRLGLHRPEVRGPTVLTRLARAVAGHHVYVRWDQVEIVPGGAADIVVHGEPGEIPPTSR